jgi:hypothetical protein
VFFLAPDDEAAAATRLRGPGQALESVACRFIEPDSAIAEWDMYFEEPSMEMPSREQLYGWSWPAWVTIPVNDGIEVFTFPRRLTQALADASSTELETLAERWAARLRSADGDDMTDDDLLMVLQDCPARGVRRKHGWRPLQLELLSVCKRAVGLTSSGP